MNVCDLLAHDANKVHADGPRIPPRTKGVLG